MAEYFPNTRDAVKSGIVTTGDRGTILCNLPHGLDVIAENAKHEPISRVVINGRNHPRAIHTGGGFEMPGMSNDGSWGVTPNVSADFWKAFKAMGHPAINSGSIQFVDGDSAEKAQDVADAIGDAVVTGTAPINSARPAPGVEPAGKDDDG